MVALFFFALFFALVLLFVVALVAIAIFLFVLFVVALFFFALAVVGALECERDRFHAFGELEDRSAAFGDCFEGVLEALLQLQAVGHHQRGVLHALPVTQRGLVTVWVTADRDQCLDAGEPVTGHVRDDVGPDAGRDEDGGSGWRNRRLAVALGVPFVTPARRGTERNGREGCERDPCPGSRRAGLTVNDDGAWTWEVLHG